MYLSVIDVKPLENYRLLLKFENNEQRIFNVFSFLDEGKFKELKEISLFNSVRICFDSIQWANELDFDPEFLYHESVIVNESTQELPCVNRQSGIST
ncbi:MAG: DUF2442 domain-containing protein [Deltaproteobacteria bacterium]|nr:MAG: DUF2442 domain-containing protein [Deltaproteobacteria bacterium]